MIKWSSCRTVGNLKILKVSYLALAVAPFASAYLSELRDLGLNGCQIFALYYASLSLAIANILYDVFCPTVIKRFSSPNDLFRDMISIKEISSKVYPRSDKFVADYEHARRGWVGANISRKIANWIVFLLFIFSSLLFLYLIAVRTVDLSYKTLGMQSPDLCPLCEHLSEQ